MAEAGRPRWMWAAPAAAWALLAAELSGLIDEDGGAYLLLAPPVLILTIFAAVSHAETVSVRLGETLGAIVLALSVTAIEVSLIATIMLEGGDEATSFARDTVFAGVMIVLNGVVGAALLVGAARHREQTFQLQGTASALSVLGALAGITMVLPDYTVAEPGPFYSPVQLAFVAPAAFALCVVYLALQAGSLRQYFASATGPAHEPVSDRAALVGGVALVASLAAVVLLADSLAPALRRAVQAAGLPHQFGAVIVAMMVLTPEGLSAIRAAHGDRLQTSLNLAIGSAVASIGLTIPAIALMSLALDVPIALGLEPEHLALLILSLFVATMTLSTGRTTVLQGAVHLALFVVFLVIAAVP